MTEQGGGGHVVRVSLAWDRDDARLPGSVAIKFATAQPHIREVMHRFGYYRSEIDFYQRLSATAGIPTPRCWAADIDPATGFFVLVLEDMSQSRLGGSGPAPISDVTMSIDHLARFHARWWSSAELRALDWLMYPEGPVYERRVTALQQSFGAALGRVRECLGASFPDVLTHVGERLLADPSRFLATRRTATPTLVHRDFHPQQIFFPTETGGRFAVFDWQTVGIGRGPDDLARIVSVGLSRADRERHDHALIARYHGHLVESGVADYALEQCVHEFRIGLTSTLMTIVRAAAAFVPLSDGTFDRLAAAFEAYDVAAVI